MSFKTTCLILITAIYFALPNFFDNKFLLGNRINFGLDLRGGSSLLLKVDFPSYLKDKMDIVIADISNNLTTQKIEFHDIKNNQGEISLKFNQDTKYSDIKKIVHDVNDELMVSCNKNNLCKISFLDLPSLKKSVLSESINTINRRVDESGTKEALIQSQGDDGIIVQVPGLDDPAELKSLLGKTAKLSFHLLSDKKSANMVRDKHGNQYPIKRRVELTGELLNDASVRFNKFGAPVVTFKFNNAGSRKFAQITKENVSKPFAIILDNQILTVPVIREPILGGQGEISGKFTLEEAKELSILLRSGALPAPLGLIEERIVGPSLGADAIVAGIKASNLSILVISLFMILVYGKFGLCAAITLLMNMLIMLGGLSLIGATLTLPGIAGFVLTIGMAVDANVLIFERIKEELATARSFKGAIAKGFKNAMTTILDSNITTLIAALIMFSIGVGPVKGFAVTLSIGILSSMLSAIVITRQIIHLFR